MLVFVRYDSEFKKIIILMELFNSESAQLESVLLKLRKEHYKTKKLCWYDNMAFQ